MIKGKIRKYNGFDGTEGYTFTEDKKEGTWVGNATSVQFAAKYQVRASKIVITIGGSSNPVTVSAPTIDGTTPFINKTTVTINAAEGAKIYYTTETVFLQLHLIYIVLHLNLQLLQL